MTKPFKSQGSILHPGHSSRKILQIVEQTMEAIAIKQERNMETTVSIEFTSNTEEHLRTLEHQLKHIHDVEVDLLEPKNRAAPALVSIGIDKGGARGERAAQSIAQVLHSFLHDEASAQSQKKIFLITIEGERVDIEPLSIEEIQDIIVEALEGEN